MTMRKVRWGLVDPKGKAWRVFIIESARHAVFYPKQSKVVLPPKMDVQTLLDEGWSFR